jgi:mRNA interferase HigB
MVTRYTVLHAGDSPSNVARVLGTSPAEGPIRAWVAVATKARWTNPAEIKRQFGTTVDFVGDNRIIFDLGGNKYRLVVHVSFAFGRLLVKFIGTHAEYDRIDPETVSWRKK